LTSKSAHPIAVAFSLNDDSRQPYKKELSSLLTFTSFKKIAHESNILVMATDDPISFIQTDDELALVSSFRLEPVVEPSSFGLMDMTISGNLVVGNLILNGVGYVFCIQKTFFTF